MIWFKFQCGFVWRIKGHSGVRVSSNIELRRSNNASVAQLSQMEDEGAKGLPVGGGHRSC